MDTASCKTDIVNRALSVLREQGIVDATIDPITDTERLINMWFEVALQECLIDIVPPFAIKRVILNKEKEVDFITLKEIKRETDDKNLKTEGAVFGDPAQQLREELTSKISGDQTIQQSKKNNTILFAYRIPSDCLRILNNRTEYIQEIFDNQPIIEGNYIYSTIKDKYILRYLCNSKELYSREIKFNLCLSYCLAYYICADLTNSDSKIQLFLKLKNNKTADTRTYYQKQIGIRFIKEYYWKK